MALIHMNFFSDCLGMSVQADVILPQRTQRQIGMQGKVSGGKHKVLILWHLSKHGVLRFGELQRLMPQATPKMLTQQLRELEADGMLHRELYHQVPPKTEYSLTERGDSFTPVLNAMCEWGGSVLEEMGAEAGRKVVRKD